MAQYRDIDMPTGVKLRVNGDLLIPSSFGVIAEGAISGNSIYEGGALLSSKYLGLNATAADSTKLGGFDAVNYMRTSIDNLATGTLRIKAIGNDTNGLYIPFPAGGSYVTKNNLTTGAIKITLPVSWTSTMLRFAVDIYDWSTNKSFTVHIAGYNYASTSAWSNSSAYILGNNLNRDFTIRFGHDGTKCCVYIGELNSTWSYPQIRVRDFSGGYGGHAFMSWDEGWSVDFEATAFGTVTATVTDCMVKSSYAKDSDKLDGQHGSYYAIATHNHDTAYLGINAKATDSSKLGGVSSDEFIKRDGSVSITGNLNSSKKITASGFSNGTTYRTHEKTYSVSTSITAALLDIDGNNFDVNKSYKVVGIISGTTTTRTSSIAYFIGNGTTFVLKNAHRSGANLNHIDFYLNSTVPSVKTWHASPYDVSVLATEIGNYGNGLTPFGVEQLLSLNDGNSPTILSFNNNVVYHAGNLAVSDFVKNNAVGQQVTGDFSVADNSTLYVGTGANKSGVVMVKGAGANVIQIDGANGTKLSGVKIYMNANGNAEFTGTISAASIAVTSSTMVTNLNAEKLAGKSELDFAKTASILELGGYGVQSGLTVTAQSPSPNMSVRIAAGVAYTDTGRRYDIAQVDQSIVAASATYARFDIIYVYGSKNAAGGASGALEGTIGYAQGTPAASPVDPAIPTGAIKLARITIAQNQGTIQTANISNITEWRHFSYDGSGFHVRRQPFSIESNITSDNTAVTITKPIKGTSWAKSHTIAAGSQSITWTHNLGLGTSYVIALSSDSPNRHIYWKSKLTNSIVLWIDDPTDVAVVIDAVITAV